MKMLMAATATIVLLSGSAAAQATPAAPARAPTTTPAPTAYRGRLVGVFDGDTGEPVSGVEIKNLLNGISALTSATGTLTLSFVDTTGGMLSIRKLGYDPQVLTVANSVHDTVGITIVLKRVPQLPAVVTNATAVDSLPTHLSPNLRGFEERRHEGFGNFLTEAQLRKEDGRRLSDLLPARLPGAHIRPGRGTAQYLVGRAGCPTTVYMDGVLYYKSGGRFGPPPDFSLMQADEYAGIEYYSSSATLPMQYSADRTSGCGTVLLWTRER